MSIPFATASRPAASSAAVPPPLKRPTNAFRKKPPSTLAIYKQQDFYEPQFDGCMGEARRDHADELAPYRKLLDRLEVDVDDQDEDTDPVIDHSDTSCPWA